MEGNVLDSHWRCFYCRHELIWQSDYNVSDVYGGDEDDDAICTVLTCSYCGRDYTITDPDREARCKEYNEYWKEE